VAFCTWAVVLPRSHMGDMRDETVRDGMEVVSGYR